MGWGTSDKCEQTMPGLCTCSTFSTLWCHCKDLVGYYHFTHSYSLNSSSDQIIFRIFAEVRNSLCFCLYVLLSRKKNLLYRFMSLNHSFVVRNLRRFWILCVRFKIREVWVCTMPGKYAVMYMCGRYRFCLFLRFFLLNFGTVWNSVVYFFFHFIS